MAISFELYRVGVIDEHSDVKNPANVINKSKVFYASKRPK